MASVSQKSGASPVPEVLPELLKTDTSSSSASSSSPSPSEDSSPAQSPVTDMSEKKLPAYAWMVKPCFVYKDEYKDCKSFKARFHQYFIDGDSSDCSQWKKDHNNCLLWEGADDLEALKRLIESEKSRVKKRLRDHYSNDVWENRTAPPEDWNKELPESIKKSYENTVLAQKVEELKSGKVKLGKLKGGDPYNMEGDYCSIV